MYRVALLYKRGDKYAKIYVSTAVATLKSGTTRGDLQIRTEPLGIIRVGFRTGRGEDVVKSKGEDNSERERTRGIEDATFAISRVSRESI